MRDENTPDGGGARTALALTNGWDGEGLDEHDRDEVKRAWSQWLERLTIFFKEKER